VTARWIPFPDDNETLQDGDELSVLGTAR